uniref:Cellular retinoic acid binding protein 2 n=2 Tax=Rattus norvegicus TaxID=10116 RepID=A0A8L2Q848_RAT
MVRRRGVCACVCITHNGAYACLRRRSLIWQHFCRELKGVNMMMRKIAVAAASKPAVEIKQENDDTFYIKTSTTVRTTEINFKIGEEFEEQTVDGRPCKSLVKWESENKMVCEQRLLKGEGPKTSWSRELTNDGELILTMTADDVVCTRVYVRE